MKSYKKYLNSILALVIVSLAISSCGDFSRADLEAPSGDADFTTVVAVGNSLTAGFQSNALFETGQRYSFPALVAGQIATVQDFEQPLISDPGIGGRIGLEGETLSNPSPTEQQGSPINANLERPYNNLGVPGAILADFTGQNLPGNSYSDRKSANPFFNIVLRDFGNTQAEQMATLEPSFVMFWLGNNDVLGYVTSGGVTPYVPPTAFNQLYGASMQAISKTGADAVLYNIPNVTSIPYVFLVNAQLMQGGTITVNPGNNYALVTPAGNAPIWIEATNPNNPGVVQDTVQMSAPNPTVGQPGAFFILPASSQLTGLFASGVGTTAANPIPHNLVLDSGETLQALQVIGQYNATIASQASSNSFALVDINSIFADIIATFQTTGMYEVDGVSLAPIPGELFSLDGVHPGNRGYGIIANSTIEVINNFYGADLQRIDISTIPQGIPINN